jgi:tetratricopeptide (TPR) repeat protein
MPRAHAITEVLTSIIPVGLLLVACVCSFIGKDRRAFWLALFFLVLAPTSSIIPIITEVAAERRMYLPSLGLMVFIFSAIHYVLCKYKLAKVVPVLLSCCTVALAISTFARAGVYRSQITLYEDTVAKYPNNRRAARNLGSWYYEHQQYEKSLQTYEDVLTRWPKDWHVQTDRAIVLVKLNRLEDAAHVLESIREQIANDALAMSLLGDVYRKMDQWDKAQRAYEQAIAVDKTNAYQHKTFLANAYAHQQKWLDAIHWQKQALENSAPIPRSHRAAVWNMLGMYYGITDQYELAAKAFKTALSWPKDTAPQTLEDARANLAKAMEMIQLKSQRKTQDKPTI